MENKPLLIYVLLSCCPRTSSPLPAITPDTLCRTSVDLHDLIFLTRNVTVKENKLIKSALSHWSANRFGAEQRAEHIVQEIFFLSDLCTGYLRDACRPLLFWSGIVTGFNFEKHAEITSGSSSTPVSQTGFYSRRPLLNKATTKEFMSSF